MCLHRLHIVSISLLIIFLRLSGLDAQYSGLRFKGHNVPLDQRTSLNLSPGKPIPVGSEFELSFDLKFEPNASYFGYVFRAIVNGENYDFICTPSINSLMNFHIVIGEKISTLSFNIPLESVTKDWNQVQFSMDAEKKEVSLGFNDSLITEQLDQDFKKAKMRLFFGAHRFEGYNSTDVPAMNLRQIKIFRNNKLIHNWPLDQLEGGLVTDLISSKYAKVSNPVWVLDLYSNWQKKYSNTYRGRLSQAYDKSSNNLIIYTSDSIYTLDCGTGIVSGSFKNNYCPLTSDFHIKVDPVTNELIGYSIDRNKKINLSIPGIHCEEPEGNVPLTIYWHHNSIIYPANRVLFTFGGYGQLTYSNSVFRFNDYKGAWDTLAYQGTFYPRYLAGLGYNEKDQKIYILGGYGSKTGNQEINPGYYYELLTYSVKENMFSKLTDFNSSIGDFCFSNTLYIDTATNTLYGLKFSKYEANQKLQAVAISLDDYTFKKLGEAFDIKFLDINSTIELYYNQIDKKLISVTTFLENGNSELSVHEISYPPINAQTTGLIKAGRKSGILLYLTLGTLLLFVLGLMIILRNRRSLEKVNSTQKYTLTTTTNNQDTHPLEKLPNQFDIPVKPGSILIFGGFQVIDRNGNDITGSFSPLLKELFLIIMLSSVRLNKGVSSQKLNEIFWFDKSEQSARNNRAVNITKLRTMLEKVGECEISKETGYWKFSFDPGKIYLDYNHYLELVRANEKWNKENLLEILNLVKEGLLTNINAEWLDNIKAEVSNEIIDRILDFIDSMENADDPEFIVQLCNCIFQFDMANEEAMIIKCKTLVSLGKHSLAKKAYEKFEKEYEILYAEKYSKSFNKVLEEDN